MAQRETSTPLSSGPAILGMLEGQPTRNFSSLSIFQHVKWQHMVAGVCGGVVSTLAVHPLDLVKIRFQVNEGLNITKRPQYTGIINAVSSILRSHGIRGLYQGVTPNVWGAGSSWGFYFLFYNALKSHWRQGDEDVVLAAHVHMLLATQSGILTLALTNPLWVAKTRLCLQYDHVTSTKNLPKTDVKHYRGLVDCLHKTYKYEGMRGLYKGFVPGIFGVSHGALQFMAYEELKKVYNSYRQQPQNKKLGTAEYLCFAAISKIFAATVTYPYQVVRARLQDQHRAYNGVVDVVTQTFRNEGLHGFYKGLVPGVLRVTPACCITFVVYENMVAFLQSRSAEDDKKSESSS